MRDWAIAVLRIEERGESVSGRWINGKYEAYSNAGEYCNAFLLQHCG